MCCPVSGTRWPYTERSTPRGRGRNRPRTPPSPHRRRPARDDLCLTTGLGNRADRAEASQQGPGPRRHRGNDRRPVQVSAGRESAGEADERLRTETFAQETGLVFLHASGEALSAWTQVACIPEPGRRGWTAGPEEGLRLAEDKSRVRIFVPSSRGPRRSLLTLSGPSLLVP